MANQEKVLQYEHFLNDELKEDLRRLHKLRDNIYEELAQYYQLQTIIENVLKGKEDKQPVQTQVNIGCNFYAQAVVDDPSKIFMSVGYGFFAEFTHQEALNYIEKRTVFLNKRVEGLSKRMAGARSKMRLVIEALRELLGQE